MTDYSRRLPTGLHAACLQSSEFACGCLRLPTVIAVLSHEPWPTATLPPLLEESFDLFLGVTYAGTTQRVVLNGSVPFVRCIE